MSTHPSSITSSVYISYVRFYVTFGRTPKSHKMRILTSFFLYLSPAFCLTFQDRCWREVSSLSNAEILSGNVRIHRVKYSRRNSIWRHHTL